MAYDWGFSVILRYKEAFLLGTWMTLKITILCIVFGTLAGGVLALLRLTKSRILRFLSVTYIELFRGIPLLVLLVWLYYCMPIFLKINLGNAFTAVLALSINLSAFAAETIRSGIIAIPRGQTEVAQTLGLRSHQVFFRIILPQAGRVIIPNMVGLWITMLKLSSLASVIAVYELLHSSNTIISQAYRPLEIYTVIALIYLAIILPATFLSRRLEAKIRAV